MKVIIVKDADEMGKVSADYIQKEMEARPEPVLGLATGSTPLPLYKELIRRYRKEGLDFSKVTTFNLDEYVGLVPTHDQSYRYFMNDNLFDHINVRKDHTFVPDGMAEDVGLACTAYERMMTVSGGIDIQVLGIGGNGHIAFNEPGSSLDSLTRVKTLTKKTIDDNTRFFEKREDVPTQAITMGIGSIMHAHRVLLLASGANKADAVAASVEGPISAHCPASALQNHRKVVFVITEDAATKLQGEYERPEDQLVGMSAFDWEY